MLPHRSGAERLQIRDITAEPEWCRTAQVQQLRRLAEHGWVSKSIDIFQDQPSALWKIRALACSHPARIFQTVQISRRDARNRSRASVAITDRTGQRRGGAALDQKRWFRNKPHPPGASSAPRTGCVS